MKVEKFHIQAAGDQSVGIPSVSFEVSGGFEFEDQEDLEYFRRGLEMVFGDYMSEMVGVETDDERKVKIIE